MISASLGTVFSRVKARYFFSAIFIVGLFFPLLSQSDSIAKKSSDTLFGLNKLWTIHLKVTPEQWKAIEPARSMGGPGMHPFGGRSSSENTGERPNRQMGGFGGPGGFGGRPGGPGGHGGPMGGVDFPYITADFEFEGTTIQNVGIRYKGQSSYMMAGNTPKKSFKIDFDRFDKNQKFFQMRKINMNNNTMDPSQMVESLAYETFHEFDIAAPRTAHAKVYLTVAGEIDRQYLGVYTMVEQIDETFLKRHFDETEGLLLKPQMIQGFPYYGRDWALYERPYEPKSSNITWKQANRFMNFAQFVNDATGETFSQKIEEYMDVDQFLRFLAVHVVIGHYDSILAMGQNYYIYEEPELKKILWIPWDLNLSFGKFMMVSSPVEQMQASIGQPSATQQPVIEKVLANPAFKEKYLGYIREFIETVFQPDRIKKNIEIVHATIEQAVKEDPNGSYENYLKCISDEPIDMNSQANMFSPPGGPPTERTDDGTEEDAQGARRGRNRGFRGGPPMGGGFPGGPPMIGSFSIASWIAGRRESVQAQLEGTSEGVQLSMMGRGPGGRGGPGGPGGGPGGFGPGGPGGFGPGMFLGPLLLTVMDQDQNEKIVRDEFEKISEEWSTAWDKDSNKSLTEQEILDGFAEIFPIPKDMPFGPPEGFSNGQFFISSFMNKANSEGVLSPIDFTSLWSEWFNQWDADQNNELDAEETANGLNAIAGPPPGMMDGPPGMMDGPPGF